MKPFDLAVRLERKEIQNYLLIKGAKHTPGQTEIEVSLFGNEEQASLHEELGKEEKRYNYEFHARDLSEEQIEYLKEVFEEYAWDTGFAVTEHEYKQEGDLFQIVFKSKKYFKRVPGCDWSDRDLSQNIVARLLEKEQFFCHLRFSGHRFEEKDIKFIDDEKNMWVVEISKGGRLEKIIRNRREVLNARSPAYELHNASDELKADREVVLAAVQDSGRALHYASDELKADREIVLTAMNADQVDIRNALPSPLAYLSDEFKSDREIVLAALSTSSEAFEYVDDELKSDREIVLAAVQGPAPKFWGLPSPLAHADEKFRADREIALAALEQAATSSKLDIDSLLALVDESLKSDREFVLAVVQKNASALNDFDEKFKADPEIALAAVQASGSALEFAADEFKSDREIVLAAVLKRGEALQYASEEVKADREIYWLPCKILDEPLIPPDDLKADREIVLAAAQQMMLLNLLPMN